MSDSPDQFDDGSLTRLLDRSAGQPSLEARDLARAMAMETRHRATKRATARRWRLRGILAATAAGAVLLTGATTMAAYQLSVPPFAETDPGMQRLSDPIQVNYVRPDGKSVQCGVYLEFFRLNDKQLRSVTDYVTNHDWSALRATVAARAAKATNDTEQGDLVANSLDPALVTAAKDAVPGVGVRDAGPGQTYSGYTMSCLHERR